MTAYELRGVHWSLGSPLKSAYMYVKGDHSVDDDTMPIPDEVLNQPTPELQPGDRIMVNGYDERLTVPIITGPATVGTILQSIEAGMNLPLEHTPLNDDIVRKFLRDYPASHGRQLMQLYRGGQLTPGDILADHRFFEGGLSRGRNGVWTYYLGS
jgi:hypothetical protein